MTRRVYLFILATIFLTFSIFSLVSSVAAFPGTTDRQEERKLEITYIQVRDDGNGEPTHLFLRLKGVAVGYAELPALTLWVNDEPRTVPFTYGTCPEFEEGVCWETAMFSEALDSESHSSFYDLTIQDPANNILGFGWVLYSPVEPTQCSAVCGG